MHYAVEFKYVDLLKFLMKAGCSVNIPDFCDKSPLYIACSKGYLKLCKLLLNNGAKCLRNTKGFCMYSEMQIASRGSHCRIIKALLKSGIDVNIIGLDRNSALHIACETEIVKLLLKWNANISHTNYDRNSPLHVAISHGNIKIAMSLLENLVENDINDSHIHASYSAGQSSVNNTLLVRNNVVNVSNSKGETPIHLASEK